ncbi:hypothetical protein F5878DRAFT_667349 [Lentinula raphanica]|uniref:Uncharacterized protein n=1 Tax=Lentinula raphanica TaxID=153919 RepID=A0AA38NVZ3_9AGAR|nr:hypothetical protein F5878DRAFT_667349 [Lentinula raphanica]
MERRNHLLQVPERYPHTVSGLFKTVCKNCIAFIRFPVTVPSIQMVLRHQIFLILLVLSRFLYTIPAFFNWCWSTILSWT